MRDDYSSRQAARDKEYADSFGSPDFQKWAATLSPEERANAEKLGLLKPLLNKHGVGSPDRDMAESNRSRTEATTPEPLEPMQTSPVAVPQEEVFDALCRFMCEALSQSNTRLTVECIALACGMTIMEGESMTSIAKRHGITRAAVSRRCVDITKKLNLTPSRSMRSTKARTAYRQVQKELSEKKTHERNALDRTRRLGKPEI